MKYIANPVEVEAFRIEAVAQPTPLGHRSLLLDNESTVICTREMAARYIPVPGDYWVVQQDGYEYVNPAAVFERKYSRVPGC